jgi:hypothetical protein
MLALTIVKNEVFANQDYGGLNQDELARILLLVKTLFSDKNILSMSTCDQFVRAQTGAAWDGRLVVPHSRSRIVNEDVYL